MKKTLFITLILLFNALVAQEKSLIKPQVLEIIENSKSGNFDKFVENIYPKVFEIIPKEQMITMMKQMSNNPEFKISFQNINPDLKISEVKKINGGKYVMVQYTNSMIMKFKNLNGIDPKIMLNVFKEAYKDGKVTYNESEKSFNILAKSKLLAISDEFTNGKWKYLGTDKNIQAFLDEFISEDVKKAFGL